MASLLSLKILFDERKCSERFLLCNLPLFNVPSFKSSAITINSNFIISYDDKFQTISKEERGRTFKDILYVVYKKKCMSTEPCESRCSCSFSPTLCNPTQCSLFLGYLFSVCTKRPSTSIFFSLLTTLVDTLHQMFLQLFCKVPVTHFLGLR